MRGVLVIERSSDVVQAGSDSAAGGIPAGGHPVQAEEPGAGLTFSAVARLELDELLTQLVDRAQDVLATQGRLRGLLRASRVITTDLRLPVLLRLIVEAACELLNARYGAVGVIAPDRTLEEFIHVGMEPNAPMRIGHLPSGHGLLGALISDPRPRRVDDIEQAADADGFPPGHPSMKTFLGVPILVRGEVFGNLYLTDRRDGRPFTAEDEELVLALAAQAGVAIENARLFQESQLRHQWMSTAAELTRMLMTGTDGPLELVSERLRTAASAQFATVVLAEPPTAPTAATPPASVDGADGGRRAGRVAVVLGERADRPVELAGTLVGRALAQRRAFLVDNPQTDAAAWERTAGTASLLVLPLPGEQAERPELAAVVLLGRDRGVAAFTAIDLEMAAACVGHVAVALELARARAERERLLVAEDRGRIARDLHDHVIQRIFAVALGLQDLAQYENPVNGERLGGYVEDIDATIKDIRNTIFELRPGLSAAPGRVRGAIIKIAQDSRPGLGCLPTVHFAGPVDSVMDPSLADHVFAVIREALANVARHAHCSAVTVSVQVIGADLVIEIVDDGVGLGVTSRRSGLDNLRIRAESLGGVLTLSCPDGGGTLLRWSIPL